MTWDQPDLWGVKPTPAADTYRHTTARPRPKTCWADCPHCGAELHRDPGTRDVYRVCTEPGGLRPKCRAYDEVCALFGARDIPRPAPGWDDY